MVKILKVAMLIAAPYSVVVGMLSFAVSLNFLVIYEESTETTYYGIDAVSYLVGQRGVLGYLQDSLAHVVFFFMAILIALVIQGLIYRRQRIA